MTIKGTAFSLAARAINNPPAVVKIPPLFKMALQSIKTLLILDIKAKIEVSGTKAEGMECLASSDAILAPLCSI